MPGARTSSKRCSAIDGSLALAQFAGEHGAQLRLSMDDVNRQSCDPLERRG